MNLKSTFISIFILTISSITWGQLPNSFKIGEDELSGVDIYSIHQDLDLNIWLGTNDGVYVYDGYDFKRINSDQSKSRSFFSIKEDGLKNKYCCNLSGQIFLIEDDFLQLYFELPDSALGQSTYFEIDDSNNLLVESNGIYHLNEKKELRQILRTNDEGEKPRLGLNFPSNKIGMIDRSGERLVYWSKNSVLEESIPLNNVKEDFYLEFQLLNEQPVLSQMQSLNFFSPTNLSNSLVKNLSYNRYRLRSAFPASVCITNKWGGLSFNSIDEIYNLSPTMLKNEIVYTEVFYGKEGMVWLGTKGSGLEIFPSDNNKVYSLKSSAQASQMISLIGLTKELHYFEKSPEISKFYSHDYLVETVGELITSEVEIRNTLNFIREGQKVDLGMSFERNFKDCDRINDSTWVFAAAQGCGIIEFSKIIGQDKYITSNSLEGLRAYCTSYNGYSETAWVGTNKGLKTFKDGNWVSKTLNGEELNVFNIISYQDLVLIISQEPGMLIFKDTSYLGKLTKNEGLLESKINRFQLEGDHLYLSFSSGIQRVNLVTLETVVIKESDGLISNSIEDFTVIGDTLWAQKNNLIQKFDLSKLHQNSTPPKIEITKIVVDGAEFDFLNVSEFEYDENDIEISFKASGHRHRGVLKYHYILHGYDKSWRSNSYLNNYITYYKIDPGEYSFELFATNENGIESEHITWQFEVNPPFWKTTWFIVIMIFLALLIISVLYRVRISRLKTRESIERKLKSLEIRAIKAQMNPHFIFNALNSVQDLIAQKDVRNSNIYLGKFADLMRKTLENSSKDEIHLSEEIKMLDLYLELEKLRFGEEFTYQINHELNREDLNNNCLPPLLLQPYVENAIKHGLLHKSGDKSLDVHILKSSEGIEICIEDNGIGRLKSQEINQKNNPLHNSFATGANKRRVDLLNQSRKQQISIEIIDLPSSGGTKVVINLASKSV